MGFSVSGAAAVVFVGMFIAFGMWYTASANSFERVTAAQADRTEEVLETRNTDVEVVSATHNGTHLIVDVNNTGASQLRLSTTDLLIDGRFETGWAGNATVGATAHPDTDLWLSGEELSIVVAESTQPDRVKVVSETGVSDASGVRST